MCFPQPGQVRKALAAHARAEALHGAGDISGAVAASQEAREVESVEQLSVKECGQGVLKLVSGDGLLQLPRMSPSCTVSPFNLLLFLGVFLPFLSTVSILALQTADAAFFRPSILSQLSFPAQHKLAMYLPFFLPATLPLAIGFAKEVRRAVRGPPRM